jgi:hypothetical protein
VLGQLGREFVDVGIGRHRHPDHLAEQLVGVGGSEVERLTTPPEARKSHTPEYPDSFGGAFFSQVLMNLLMER